jgi:large subunit ribosomal protein L3
MARGIIAKKLGMTQIFDDAGKIVPVTVLQAGPCKVTQVKTVEKENYTSVQMGFESAREKVLNKAELGHLKKGGNEALRVLREFRDMEGDYEPGSVVKADIFQAGDRVKVTGTSKGKGFQGVQKRYGFGGGRATHGSKFHRAPGSMGAGTYPAKVFKGKRMPGQTGAKIMTTTHLEIVMVDAEKDLVMIKGAIPGPRTGIVKIEAM